MGSTEKGKRTFTALHLILNEILNDFHLKLSRKRYFKSRAFALGDIKRYGMNSKQSLSAKHVQQFWREGSTF